MVMQQQCGIHCIPWGSFDFQRCPQASPCEPCRSNQSSVSEIIGSSPHLLWRQNMAGMGLDRFCWIHPLPGPDLSFFPLLSLPHFTHSFTVVHTHCIPYTSCMILPVAEGSRVHSFEELVTQCFLWWPCNMIQHITFGKAGKPTTAK